jgi:hypothetical protein
VIIARINPNPVEALAQITCVALEATTITCRIYSNEGALVKEFSSTLAVGTNLLITDLAPLSAGAYYLVLSRPNERITEAKFIKN